MPPQPDGPLTPEQRLAASLEQLFAGHQQSLTDDATRLTYTITIGAFRTMLQGARTKGVLAEEAHRDLDAMLAGMLTAAQLLG